jgi:hypothetical protein
MASKRTIYLPDELTEQVENYLRLYPGKSFSALVQEVLAERVAPRDLPPILELAGFVASGTDVDNSDSADRFKDRPEDRFYDRAR